MTYTNKNELIAQLQSGGLYLKKELGQNFLINPEILVKIMNSAEIGKDDLVVEIGPGMGILTVELAKKAKRVISYEIDTKVYETLKPKLKGYDNVELINLDALKSTLPTSPYKLVANIPYYITSPILNHFLDNKDKTATRPQVIVLLVQKEVAEKVCSKDGNHNVLSLEVQVFGKPSIEGTVSAGNFFPPPKVDSAILKVKSYERPMIEDTNTFFKLIKAAFSQRRKTLSNSMKNQLGLERDVVQKILDEAGIDPQRRPQELSITEWNKMVTAYVNFTKPN